MREIGEGFHSMQGLALISINNFEHFGHQVQVSRSTTSVEDLAADFEQTGRTLKRKRTDCLNRILTRPATSTNPMLHSSSMSAVEKRLDNSLDWFQETLQIIGAKLEEALI